MKRLLIASTALAACLGVIGLAVWLSSVTTKALASTLNDAHTGKAPAEASSAPPPAGSTEADTRAPKTTAFGFSKRWRRTAVTITLKATDDTAVKATRYRIDNGPWITGSRPHIAAPKDHRNDGEHVVRFFSIDVAGNSEVEKSVTVRIDTTPPRASWRGVSPAKLTQITNVRMQFFLQDASRRPLAVRLQVSNQYGTTAVNRGPFKRLAGQASLTIAPRYSNGQPLLPGLYRLRLIVTDEAGNTTVTPTRSLLNLRSTRARAFSRLPKAGKRVALTFDDGPSPAAWRSILNSLRTQHAHASFFPLGSAASSAPDLMRRTAREGHGIGTHGATHTTMTSQSIAAVRNELRRGAAPWAGAGVSAAPYARPPYGSYNSSTLAAFGAEGYERMILWDVDPRDWQSPGSSVIAQRVLGAVRPGSIVVMHLRPQTAAALPQILRGLKRRGYRAVSLPELFRAAAYR